MADRPMINVGCKMPNGLNLHVMSRVEGRNDADAPQMMFKDHGFINLPGFAAPKLESFAMVDKELWMIWVEENKDNILVTDGFVFAAEPELPAPVKAKPAATVAAKA